jgi:hypothetical protein
MSAPAVFRLQDEVVEGGDAGERLSDPFGVYVEEPSFLSAPEAGPASVLPWNQCQGS